MSEYTSFVTLPPPIIDQPGMRYFAWAHPVDGAFSQPGAWLLDGAPTQLVPTASDAVAFSTDSALPYTVTGDVTAAYINILADSVSFTGALTASRNIVWQTSGGFTLYDSHNIDFTGTQIKAGGTLWLQATDSIDLGAAEVTAGSVYTEAGEGISLQPDGAAESPGSLTLTSGGLTTVGTLTTAALDSAVTAVGGTGGGPITLTSDGGSLTVTGVVGSLTLTPVSAAADLPQVSAPPPPAALPLPVASPPVAPMEAGPQVTPVAPFSPPLASAGNQTLVGAQGGDFLFGPKGGGAMLFGGPGTETLVADSGDNTLAGGGSGDVMFGGTGASTMFGAVGGGDTMVGGAGSTMMALASGDIAFGSTGANQMFGSAAGADTMVGGTAGTTTMIGAGAQDVFVGSTGASTVFTGAGASTVFAGPGPMLVVEGSGADTVLFGPGNATVFAGSGTNLFDFVNGAGGGHDMIAGFKPGTDQISLFGYDASAVRAQAAGGATSFVLGDGTSLTLAGLSHLDPGSILSG